MAQLEKACANLGDAVVDPALWPDIIEQISASAGSTGAVLLQSDVGTTDMPHSPHSAGVRDLLKAYFRDGWHTRDLRADRSFPLILKGGKSVIDQDIVTPEEMKRLAYFNEFLAPVGMRWFAGVGIAAGSAVWGLSIQRTVREGPFEASDKPALDRLSQRLSEVATLSVAVGRIALSSATNALDAMRQPAVALDRMGFVLDTNRSAEMLFDADIQVKHRRLAVWDGAARRDLDQLVDCTVTASDLAVLPCEPILVRRRGKRPVILHVLPVHGAARTPFLGARVLLTLTPVQPAPRPNAALLAEAFGLTPAEARLASIIAAGLSPERAAEELGVSPLTVRNQLKGIFGKTETHRQSELVALLARL